MSGTISPDVLETISRNVMTLWRSGELNAQAGNSPQEETLIKCLHVVYGAAYLLKRSIDGLAEEKRDNTYSIHGVLNSIGSALQDMRRDAGLVNKLREADREALLHQIMELVSAIEGAGLDIGSGIAEGLKAIAAALQPPNDAAPT